MKNVFDKEKRFISNRVPLEGNTSNNCLKWAAHRQCSGVLQAKCCFEQRYCFEQKVRRTFAWGLKKKVRTHLRVLFEKGWAALFSAHLTLKNERKIGCVNKKMQSFSLKIFTFFEVWFFWRMPKYTKNWKKNRGVPLLKYYNLVGHSCANVTSGPSFGGWRGEANEKKQKGTLFAIVIGYPYPKRRRCFFFVTGFRPKFFKTHFFWSRLYTPALPVTNR